MHGDFLAKEDNGSGEYIWNYHGGDLVLVHTGGDTFIDGASGGYYSFSSGDAVG